MSYFLRPNRELQMMVDDFFAAVSRYNDSECNAQLSVLLLGSLSKGEGSWISTENGAKMLSDVEFFVVYPADFCVLPAAKQQIEHLAKSSFSGQKSSLFHVDATFVSSDRLPRMEHKLLIYDAVHYGKWVVGRPLPQRLPQVTEKNLNRYDIRDIVDHRAFSVLSYGSILKQAEEFLQYRYVLAKNSLDLLTALSAQYGCLATTLAQRAQVLGQLALPQESREYLKQCLNYKANPQAEADLSIAQMHKQFLNLAQYTADTVCVPAFHAVKHARHCLRRRAGQFKRSLQYRHFVFKNHQKQLLLALQREQKLTPSQRRDHLVLHGYPAE